LPELLDQIPERDKIGTVTAIYDYLLQHNARPKPFVWTKSAEDILTRERRALDALDEIRGNG
jgi:hypothetical protein